MSRLVARILLSLLVFPLALVCFAALLIMFEINQVRDEDVAFFISALAALGFTFVYWTLLWRKSVRWTPKRKLAPYSVALLCAVVATVATGAMARHIDWPPFFMLTGLAVMIAWLFTTIFLWQETPLERAERLQMSNRSNISCPSCGYNLTGLNEARCPECGAKFTLDELFASQPKETAGWIE